ncbi:MAG: glycosyl transferase [Burkholderiales bacterium]|nr:glycosyl transferase [Burkholderiales bacterium]
MNEALPVFVGVAALLASLATALLLRWRARLPLARRNARTLHEVLVPRVGGIALWAGFLPPALLAPALPSASLAVWGPPWLALFVVSLADDMRGVAIAPRLAVHVVAALWLAMAVGGAGTAAGSAAMIMLVALVAVWSLNLYNFMDGSDGLAAAMTVIGFAAYGAALLQQGLPATMPLALAAATLPVLAVNRPPARMFLGDVGAVPLGFLAAAIGVGGVVDGAWAVWFPVLVFLPFIADATVTLVRRALAGERFWEGHKSHYYQRLHRMGAGHMGTLAVFGALATGTAGTAVLCASSRPEWGAAALAVWCTICALLFAAIDYHWRRHAQRT